ncbi:MAG: hypothetical protein QHH07_07885 [Sedimentisphaerales bacterium]|jgi:ABC-2 type transport system permease protein|nr:hypothetical protein [Sedimentisphaerales bacterium]
MAVYKQQYRPYEGPRTSPIWRFLVPLRYSYAKILQSRLLVLLLALCMFYPCACATIIYLSHNSPALAALRLRSGILPQVDGRFFYFFCTVQGSLAFVLTALIGPGLVWPDLANGALALYLSRPFARLEYVASKMTILVLLLSTITWLPGLVLFAIQAGCVGWDWAVDNAWLAGAILVASIVWIVVLSLIGLALSAWVRWRTAAGVAVLAVYFVGAGLGRAINNIWQTRYGYLIDLGEVMNTVWAGLFRYYRGPGLSPVHAWLMLLLVCLVCIKALASKVRGLEVVR